MIIAVLILIINQHHQDHPYYVVLNKIIYLLGNVDFVHPVEEISIFMVVKCKLIKIGRTGRRFMIRVVQVRQFIEE